MARGVWLAKEEGSRRARFDNIGTGSDIRFRPQKARSDSSVMTEKEPRPLDASGNPAAPLSNYLPVSRTTIHGKASLLFSLPFIGAGTYVTLIAAGVVKVKASSIHVPMWIIGAAGGAFLLAGISVFIHALVGLRRLARLNAQATTFPQDPWLADYEWNSEGTESREGASFLTYALGLTVAVCIMSIMNWVAFIKEAPFVIAIVAGLFDLLFLFIIGSAVRKTIAHAQHGKPTLEFGNFPVHPGQLLRVRITSNQALQEVTNFVARLRFVEERYETRGSGKNRSQVVVCYNRYEDTRELDCIGARKMATGGLELEFMIPTDARTTQLRGRPATYWDLELYAERPGLDFKHRFLIPIYDEPRARAERLAA